MTDTDLTIQFLREIGLRVEEGVVAEDAFLPGIQIAAGAIRVDRTQLLSPGDLLHEAGHLALLDPAERARANGVFEAEGGSEMGAIAWSYAASLHVGMPIETLFHDTGYRGGAASLRENFAAKRYIGVPILSWRGLLEGTVASNGYPKLARWLVG
ncbi:MAG: hypothetical protein EAZ21_10705 [Betaproteobacteria bacterium]|nr:MAG: hypothetical protein EAZ21_10705 [Betaproteobacteria bacterium]